MPFGRGLADALALALGMVKELGLASRNFDNYVGTADLNDRETRLGILAHLDVVGEGAGWSSPPYAAYVKDGMLYGRGAQDDKGPLVAALYAMKAVRDLGLPLRFNARLIMGTDEETDSADLAYYAARERFPPMTFSPDASFPVINGEKGHFSPVFEAHWAEGGALPRVRVPQGRLPRQRSATRGGGARRGSLRSGGSSPPARPPPGRRRPNSSSAAMAEPSRLPSREGRPTPRRLRKGTTP